MWQSRASRAYVKLPVLVPIVRKLMEDEKFCWKRASHKQMLEESMLATEFLLFGLLSLATDMDYFK